MLDQQHELPEGKLHISFSLNPLKGGDLGECVGEYYGDY